MNDVMLSKKPSKLKMNEKLNKVLWTIFYFVIVSVLCVSGSLFFVRNYFSPVYIDGTSMLPTLNKDISKTSRNDFGIVDTSHYAISNIELFDIVTCYYPPSLGEDDYDVPYEKGDKPREDASLKIKRVVALPLQTFEIINNEFYFYDNLEDTEGEKVELPFDIIENSSPTNVKKMTLAEDEYFVMGDNWKVSKDCANVQKPIYVDNIVGVLIAIIGTCKVQSGPNNTNKIIDKKYHWPVFYK